MESRSHSPSVTRFGDFEVDLRAGELRRGGQKVKLQQQPFRVLARLLESSGQVVTREELRRAIWPDTFVEFNEGIDEAIYKLRSALGDSAEEPRFVETLPRRGYRFIGLVGDVVTSAGWLDAFPPESARPASLWKRLRWLLVPTAVGILVTLGALARFGHGFIPGAQARAAAQPLLVVVPFENLGPPGDDYFADGMTEEITSRLAQLSGLRVVARASAMQYKGAHKSIRQIGRELGVDYVVEGSVQWEKLPGETSRVRVSAQLIRVADQTDIWAQPYDAALADVFRVQSDIASRVAQSLDVTLVAATGTTAGSPPTSNLEAYDLFLRAEAATDWSTVGDLRRAVTLFEAAIARDSSFALAYAQLAGAHDLLYWNYDRTDDRLGQIQENALHALALQPGLSQAHVALGYAYYHGYRNYERALREFALARRDDALYPIGLVERRQGEWDAAAAHLTQAATLDSREPTLFVDLGETFLLQRRYPEAERALERAIELSPSSLAYERRAWLALCRDGSAERARAIMNEAASRIGMDTVVSELVALGSNWTLDILRFLGADYQQALEHLTLPSSGDPGYYFEAKATLYARGDRPALVSAYYDSARVIWEDRIRAQPREATYHSMLGLALAGLGRKQEAIREGRVAVALLPTSKDAVDGPDLLANLAAIYLLAGDHDAAIEQLDLLVTISSPISVPLLRRDPLWAPLREDRRFEALLKRSG